ncbi:DUF4013 domain-containing protein [bacterium]|nr:DUF4013 domain-containing protein [bacterium]
MKEAFLYMLKDNKIKEKAAIYFGIMFVATLLQNLSQYISSHNVSGTPTIQTILLALSGFVISFITTGYSIICIKTIIEQKDNIVMPYINIKSFYPGLKYIISLGLLSIVIYLILIPIYVISAMVSKLIFLLCIIAIVLFVAAYLPVLTYIIATTGMWTSFFRIVRATKLINSSKWQYWKNALMICAIGILIAVLTGIITYFSGNEISGIIIQTLFTTAISSYTVYVFAYLTAKSIKDESIE